MSRPVLEIKNLNVDYGVGENAERSSWVTLITYFHAQKSSAHMTCAAASQARYGGLGNLAVTLVLA